MLRTQEGIDGGERIGYQKGGGGGGGGPDYSQFIWPFILGKRIALNNGMGDTSVKIV